MFQKNVFAQGGRRGEGRGEEADGTVILGLGGIARHQIDLPWLRTSSRCARQDMHSAALPIVRKGKEWPKDIGSHSITLYLILPRWLRTRSSLGRPSPPTAAGPSLEAFRRRPTRKGSLNASLRSSSIASSRLFPPTKAPPTKRRSRCSAT